MPVQAYKHKESIIIMPLVFLVLNDCEYSLEFQINILGGTASSALEFYNTCRKIVTCIFSMAQNPSWLKNGIRQTAGALAAAKARLSATAVYSREPALFFWS